jgi:hypothetical protein
MLLVPLLVGSRTGNKSAVKPDHVVRGPKSIGIGDVDVLVVFIELWHQLNCLAFKLFLDLAGLVEAFQKDPVDLAVQVLVQLLEAPHALRDPLLVLVVDSVRVLDPRIDKGLVEFVVNVLCGCCHWKLLLEAGKFCENGVFWSFSYSICEA